MVMKKKEFSEDEIVIFDDAVIYKRGDYWHFRMWLQKEGKYARFSLKTRNVSTATDRAKLRYHEIVAQQLQGKTYFSVDCKEGVERYLTQRWKDCEAGLIVKGRYSTIKTHLEHWLDFIKRDTKLKELDRTDCENYFYERTKYNKKHPVSQSTILNEQSTINALISWLHKQKETYIESFDFKKLPKKDLGDEALRRAMFTDDEIKDVTLQLEKVVAANIRLIENQENLTLVLVCYHHLISALTGMRRGEQLQLRWSDIAWLERNVNGTEFSLVKIRVRAETSKVRRTRVFVVKDHEYFDNLFKIQYARCEDKTNFGNTLVFKVKNAVPTVRAIDYQFDKVLEDAQVSRVDRELVPYSFRHYFITQRINSGLSPTAVAEMAGTSVTQIEQTYYHTTETKMITNALADYIVNSDGLIIPKIA